MKNSTMYIQFIGVGMIIFCLSVFACNNSQTANASTRTETEVIAKVEPVVPQSAPSVSLDTEKEQLKPLERKTLPETKSQKGTPGKPTKTTTKPAKVVPPAIAKPASNNTSSTANNNNTEPVVTKPVNTTAAPITKPKPPKPVTTTQPSKPTTTTQPTKPISLPPATKPKEPVQTTPPASSKKPALSHTLWNQLTSKYISSNGKVNYAGIKSNKILLNQYLEVLQNNPPQSNWGRNKTMAYWINAYNAFTVKLIVDNYPTSSITNLEGGDPWKKNWIKIGINTYSLNTIEKDLLIKKFNEPRVHFAVNCAAKSCPPILNKAWTESNLESNFEKSTKAFINNLSYNDVSNSKSIEISKIFEWYAADFGNDVLGFINKYANAPVKSNAKVSYKEYVWDLNE